VPENVEHPQSWLWLTVPIAALIMLVSAIGLFVPNFYRGPIAWTVQVVAQDFIDLAIVLPVLVISGFLAARGSHRAKLVCLGVLSYLVYSFVIYAFMVIGVFTCLALSVLSLVTRNQNQTVVSNHFAESVGNATSARITISPAVSQLTVSAIADSTTLFDVDATYYTDTLTFEHAGVTSKTVALKQDHGSSGFNFFSVNLSNPFANEALLWNVHLSPNVPVDPNINSGVGDTSLDLGNLKLTNLKLVSGVGRVTVTLPAGDSAYPASIEDGVGSVDIRIQKQGSINLKINGGVGSIHLSVPRDVGVRLISKYPLGSVNLLPTMQCIDGNGERHL